MKGNEKMIPVVFSTDDGYAMPTAVATKSMLDNFSGDSIQIYILYKDHLSDLSKTVIGTALEKTSNKSVQAKISYLDIGKRMEKASSHISHISAATYYRIVLPDLLPNDLRCIYLDGDVIISGDVASLGNIELSDNEYIAGVSTVTIQTRRESVRQKRMKEIGVPDFNTYVNAGMLLLNLKAFRENGLVEKMMKLVPRNYSVQDQDVINAVCYGHVKMLPPKYNVLPPVYKMSYGKLQTVYQLSDIEEAKTNPCVIHYADKWKPWQFDNVNEGERWRETYRSMFSMLNMESKHYGVQEKIIDFFLRAIRKVRNNN